MAMSDLKSCKWEWDLIWVGYCQTTHGWSRGAGLTPLSILSHAFHVLCFSDFFFLNSSCIFFQPCNCVPAVTDAVVFVLHICPSHTESKNLGDLKVWSISWFLQPPNSHFGVHTWMSACSSFLWCWKCTLVSFANGWEKENVTLIICIVLMLEATGRLVTHHTKNKFQRACSLTACHYFVWTLHSTVPNPNDKSASERCKALEEDTSKWKITTLSSVYAPLISKTPGSCCEQNEPHFTMRLYLYSGTCSKDLNDRFI